MIQYLHFHNRNICALFVLFLCLVLLSSNHIFPHQSRNLQQSIAPQNNTKNVNNLKANQQTIVNSVSIIPKIIYPITKMVIPTNKIVIKSKQVTINGQVISNKTSIIRAQNINDNIRPASSDPNFSYGPINAPLIDIFPPTMVNTTAMTAQMPFYCWTRPTTTAPKNNYNTRQKQVPTNYGFNMYVDSLDGTVSATISNSGTWEPNYISLIGVLVKPGNYVMNLGSQSGLEALVMGKIVGSKGKLFIFQPYSFSNKLVTKNIQLNNLTSITTIYKVGASDQKGTAQINIAYWNTGGSQITPIPQNLTKQQLKMRTVGALQNQVQIVQIDLVDSLLPEEVSLDFALLDVQKMEIKALKGMKKVIQRSPKLVIMTEWQYAQNPRKNQQETMNLLTWMIQRGYRIYSYSGGTAWNCKLGAFFQYTNPKHLLNLNFLDIFFFPSGVP